MFKAQVTNLRQQGIKGKNGRLLNNWCFQSELNITSLNVTLPFVHINA